MLVLKRKLGESVDIAEVITVKVLGISGGQVSIGIDAPSSVKILRSELEDKAPNTGRLADEDQAWAARSAS